MFLIDTEIPLRSDESNTGAWQRKRKLYAELANREKGLYRCINIETARGQEARQDALERILSEVLP
jgi:thymidylate kinase